MGDPASAFMVGNAALGYNASRKERKEQRRQADLQMESWRLHQPFLERAYTGAEGALNDSIDQGTYQGQTYADMNPYETAGLNFMGNMGAMNAEGAYNMAQSGQNFGQNYQDLYDSSQEDRIAKAQDYALNNSSPLIEAAMRDDRRNLTENVLPGINQNASASGNMNGSRAGMADAIANRGYSDRQADVTASIMDGLTDRSMYAQNQQFADSMSANAGQRNAYMTGIDTMGRMGDWMNSAGRAFRDYEQGGMQNEYNRFNESRDFELQQRIAYQQGILNRANTQSPDNPVGVTANPGMAALGGASQGYGYGQNYSSTGNIFGN